MVKLTKENWDEQFSQGQWDSLASLKEAGHNAIIAMYCHFLCVEAEILDVGCGLANITNFLKFKYYLGIDISEVAIQKAKEKKNGEFQCVNADDFNTDKKFDIIIFNEVLYYLDALGTLKKFETYLTEKGFFVISVWKHPQTMRLWDEINKIYFRLDSTEISHKDNQWIIGVYKRK